MTDSNGLEPEIVDEQGLREASASGGASRPLGTHNAKLVRQEELRTQAVHLMAKPAKGMSGALEDRNAIAVFWRLEAAGLPETDQFFATIRQTNLLHTFKWFRVARCGAAAVVTESAAKGPP